MVLILALGRLWFSFVYCYVPSLPSTMKLTLDCIIRIRPDGSALLDYYGGSLWIGSDAAKGLKPSASPVPVTLDVALYPVTYSNRSGKQVQGNALSVRGLSK